MNAQQPFPIDGAAAAPRGSGLRSQLLRDERFLNLGVALTLLAAGVIHGAQIAPHLEESRTAGFFFAAVTTFQTIFAAVLSVRRSRPLRIAALVLTVTTMAVWLASRTVGIPIGPHAGSPEAIAAVDAVATGLELVTATLLAALLLIPRRPFTAALARGRHRVGELGAALGMALAIATITTVALWSGPVHEHDPVHNGPSSTSANQKVLDLLEHHGSSP